MGKSTFSLAFMFMVLMSSGACMGISREWKNPFDPDSNVNGGACGDSVPAYFDDFEDRNAVNNRGGAIYVAVDSLSMGSVATLDLTAPGSGLSGGSACAGARFYGTVGRQVSPWPFALLLSDITGGFNIDAEAPTQKFHFSVKAGSDSAGRPHIVRFQHSPPTDYCYYEYNFTPTLSWTEYDLSLPGGPPPAFAKCSWGSPPPWSTAKNNLTSLVFLPVGSSVSAIPFDLTVDDLYFY